MKETAEEVSLYIHIPFCISKCAYCDFFSQPYKKDLLLPLLGKYINAFSNEIAFRLADFNVKKIQTIYIGGGTPSLLSAENFIRLFDFIKSSGKLTSDAEITVEVNPDDVNQKLLETLQACGVNRISCGIQSMNDAALKKAFRRADYKTNQQALTLFQQYWKGQLSLDLISGLPLDDEKSLIKSLEEICSVNPDHISLYSLTIEDNTPFGRQLASGQLNYDFDWADKLWLTGRDFLEEQGYKWYEVSNFCRPGKECKHNLSYWTHKNYIGCGSGACGTVYQDDGEGIRWTNSNNISEYIDYWMQTSSANENQRPEENKLPQILETIDKDTSEFEFFMMGLRKILGIRDADFMKIFQHELPEKFLQLFKTWEDKGLCQKRKLDDGMLEYAMSRQGMLFLNRFLEELC